MRTVKFPLLALHDIASICEFLWNKNTPFYVHIGQVKMHGQPDVTLVENAAHDVLRSSFLPPGHRFWNLYLRNKSIGFDNSHCIWMLVVYRGAILYPFRHRTHVEAKVWFLSRPRRYSASATTESVYVTNPNSFQIILLCSNMIIF